MILNIQTDASYLSDPNVRSRVGNYLYLVDNSSEAIDHKREITMNANIINTVVSSSTEAEYAGLFKNIKTGIRLLATYRNGTQPATSASCI